MQDTISISIVFVPWIVRLPSNALSLPFPPARCRVRSVCVFS